MPRNVRARPGILRVLHSHPVPPRDEGWKKWDRALELEFTAVHVILLYRERTHAQEDLLHIPIESTSIVLALTWQASSTSFIADRGSMSTYSSVRTTEYGCRDVYRA